VHDDGSYWQGRSENSKTKVKHSRFGLQMLVRNKAKAKRKRGTTGVQIERGQLSVVIFTANLFIPGP